jgi:glycosyltransferase involved in cell wall biosynthesis
MSMRVSYITMKFPAAAETFACTDIRTLVETGVEIDVHSMRFQPANAAALLTERGLPSLAVEYATPWHIWRGAFFALSHPRLLLDTCMWLTLATWRTPKFLAISLCLLPRSFDIVQRLEKEAPEVVHLFWGHYPSIVGYLVRRRLPDCVLSAFLGAYDLTYAYRPSALLARQADVVWTHAHENVPAIEALGVSRKRIEVAHRGVDLSRFQAAGTKVSKRIVCAARLCREKHVDHVVMAFAKVFDNHPDASLVIMGEGPERPALERLVARLKLERAVRFCGHVPHTAVRDEMARAEFFVLLSQEETERLTNATKEALACGCLCIVTRSAGIEELLTDGVHGFVLEHGDIDGAVDRIEWAIDNERDAAAIAAAGAEQVRTSFSVVASMQRYLRRWTSLVTTRRRGDGALASSPAGKAPEVLSA